MFSGQDNTVSYSNSVYYIDSTVLNNNSDYSNHCNSGSFSATETSNISISSHQCQETLAYPQDETDDLLYQFGKHFKLYSNIIHEYFYFKVLNTIFLILWPLGNYFREKLNKEVKNFCGSMSSMFDEQQIHVKQIVNAARNYEMKQVNISFHYIISTILYS